jgi:hypothetical protein
MRDPIPKAYNTADLHTSKVGSGGYNPDLLHFEVGLHLNAKNGPRGIFRR